jgi:hypothetical protein
MQVYSRSVTFPGFRQKYHQVMGVLYPFTQRHYRRLILLLILIILLHVSVVRPSSSRKYTSLLARINQLTTDPLFSDIVIR